MRAYSLSQIYTSGGAIPAIEYPLAAPVFGTISPPRSQARMMGHTPFYFESWYNVERTVTLSIVGFAALFIMLRVSGKRTLSKLNVFDFVFVVAVGSVFASMIISKDVTLIEGIAALATLIGIQMGLSYVAARFPKMERIINGEPTLLLTHGEFIPAALMK